MSRRHPKRMPEQAHDPRSRRVVSATHTHGIGYDLALECGHRIKRRYRTVPERIICTLCPRGSVRGFGGGDFGRGK